LLLACSHGFAAFLAAEGGEDRRGGRSFRLLGTRSAILGVLCGSDEYGGPSGGQGEGTKNAVDKCQYLDRFFVAS
jgi:hypothetical protein